MTKEKAKKNKSGKTKKALKPKSSLDWYVIDQVKRIRIERGYTQAELSDMLKFSDSFISQMESTATSAHYNISQLNQIAIALKCSLLDFFPSKPIIESDPRSVQK